MWLLPFERSLKGVVRSQHENRKPFAPNALKIPTRQHHCNKATSLDEELASFGQLYRDRGDSENIFDEF